jgi:hypothetical protein
MFHVEHACGNISRVCGKHPLQSTQRSFVSTRSGAVPGRWQSRAKDMGQTLHNSSGINVLTIRPEEPGSASASVQAHEFYGPGRTVMGTALCTPSQNPP